MTDRVRELHDLAKLQLAKGGKDAVKAALRSILYTITSDRRSELQNASLSCDADNAWALEYPKHYTNLIMIFRWVGETVVDPEEYLNLVRAKTCFISNKEQWLEFSEWWNATQDLRNIILPPETIRKWLAVLKGVRIRFMGAGEEAPGDEGCSGPVLRIMSESGGKRAPRRRYDEDDMQTLRDAISGVVLRWGRDELAQIDTKRMALNALMLAILDIDHEGETNADIDDFAHDLVHECEHLAAIARQSIAARSAAKQRPNPDTGSGNAPVGS
jgi:PAS domain-containing protein